MEELDEFGIPIKKTAKPSVSVDEFGIPIKKKDSSTGTVTPKKLVSGPQNGSSVGKGFPKKETKGKIVNYVKPKEDSSFFDYLKENLDTGLANVSKSLYDAPGFIYDAAASITNPVFKALGVSKDKLASSDKLANDLGFKNIPSEILKEKIKVSNDKINAYATKNGGDAFAALENGNYSGAAKLVAGSTMQSLPIMVAAMASGGQTTALAAIGLSTASTKNAELKESNPEMGLGTRVANATNAGIIEAVTGHLFTGASGAVMKKILAEKGVEAGSKIISKSFKSTIEKAIEKNPFVGALGEVVEESAVEFGNQLNDMSSGIRTEFDAHAVVNAGLSATGMGGIQTLGVYGAKGYVKAKEYAKLKATNKEVFKLRGEIANGNLSDENKALLTLRADRLEAGNKKLLGTEIEKVKALPTELKTELNALNVEFESLKSKFDDIDDADDIPDNLKPAMKEEIKVQASLNQKRKTEILSQNDGLVVDNDFSKFDGVDPDFDLENGKISSLPLKEQDRLNDLAVEKITGGDKTIEYTKEQVSQTANDIYINEQNPEASQIKETVSEVSMVPSISQVEGVSKVVDSNSLNDNFLMYRGESISSDSPFTWVTEDKDFASEYGEVKEVLISKNTKFIDVNTQSFEEIVDDYQDKNNESGSVEEYIYTPTNEFISFIKEKGYDAFQNGDNILIFDKNNVKVNEATPPSNTPTDGNVRPTANNVGENGITKSKTPIAESVPSTVDGGENKGDAEVTIGKNNKKFYTGRATKIDDFSKTKGEFIFFSKDKKVSEHYGGDNITEANVDTSGFFDLSTQEKKTAFVKENFTDEDIHKLYPDLKRRAFDKQTNLKGFKEIEKELIQEYRTRLENDRFSGDGEIQNTILRKIKEKGHTGVVLEDSFFGKRDMSYVVFDKSVINTGKSEAEVSDLDHAKSQIDKGVLNWNGDTGAERVNLGIPWADIRKGEKDIKAGKVDTVPAKRLIEALKTAKENGGYEYKQGSGGQIQKQFVSLEDIQRSNNEYELTDAEQKEVDASEFESAREYDKNFNSLSEQEQIEILENYENSQNDSGTPSADSGQSQSKNDVPSEKEGTGAKQTSKERVAERIRLSDAKIDNIRDAINGIDSIFGIKIKVDDIDGLNKNGVDIVDVIANIAKQAMAAGIQIDEAIKKTIEHLKKTIDFEVDIDAIKERLNPKKESTEGFKREKGKSSVLKRIREGGNSSEINNIIDKIGLNSGSRKQEQVYADGVNFVKEVGVVEAYNAIKNGELKDSDTINVVYATILQEYSKMAENELSKVSDPQELSDLAQELDDFHQKIYTEFKTRTIDAGRGSAILNFIYNQDLKIRYSLAQQVENFKKVNNGVIPAEVLAQMKELDKQYQDANKRIEELEGLLKEAQEQQDFQNIVDEQKREPKQSKSKREKAEKIIKALDDFEKSILRNSYSDATMITPILIQGVRAAKLAVKANVEISEAIEKAIEGIKKELGKLGKTFEDEERFRAGLNKSLESNGVDTKQPKVTVDKNGKVRIPTDMIKDFIAKGGTDLSEFAKQVKELIKDEFSNVSERDIRESVANYGKKVNKSRPQIVTDIQKLKAEERLRLEYEDLQNRISKEKNEIRKKELTQTQKRLKEQIKQLQDDLGITEIERTNRSVNYTKKRIEQLREKIKNNDFAKKEVKPIKESQELKDAKKEKNRVQEEFDYLSYQQELQNRTLTDKIKQFGSDMYDSQRVTLATGELSFVGAQGGLYMIDATFSRKTIKNLIANFKGTTAKEWRSNPFGTALKMLKSAHSGESLIKMFNTMGTANTYMDFQRMLKEDPEYDVYLKSGLRLLGEDVKSQVKDDNYIGNNILTLLKAPIFYVDKIEKKSLLNFKLTLADTEKKRTTLQGYYEKLKTGKVSDKNKKTATEIFTNANPLATFERGNNTFMNMARVEMFNKYAAALYASGKNPIDHLSDFKKLASAVNTITGSGNMSQTITMALPALNKLMFSARYFSAIWNQTPPVSLYYLAKLGNYDGVTLDNPSSWKNIKVTPAQKAFVKPMVKASIAFYGASLFTMVLINASIDDDDEMTEEEKIRKRAYIEYDPRSSDFMQVVSGDTRTNYFGPSVSNVVLLSKLATGQTNKKGRIFDNGSEFGSRTDTQIGFEYLAGKANPTPGMFIRYGMGKKEEVLNTETGIVESKRILFNKEIGIGYQVKHNLLPIFVTTVKDITKEDPVLGAEFYTTLAFLGKQTSVYKSGAGDTFEDKFLKEQAKRKLKSNLPLEEKIKGKVDNRLTRMESKIKEIEGMKLAQKMKIPYYTSSGEKIDVSDIDFSKSDEGIKSAKTSIEGIKKEYGIKDEK